MDNSVKYIDTEKIIEGCINNDRVMQTRLYYLYYPIIYKTVTRYINDDGDKEDILQEAFIKIFNHIKKLKDPQLVVPWMNRIAINLCMDKLRKNKRLQLSFEMYVEQEKGVGKEEWDGDDEEQITLTMDDVSEVMDQLPNGFKTVFMLYAIENYSHKEIGQLIGTTESNSKTQYMRAKLAIKNLVNQNLECKRKKLS